LLDEFEEAIEHLKVKYDRYFYGVDRMVPARDRARVDRMVRNLMRQHWRTTMLRYRYAQLKQRYTTYQHYWNRILGQIERGTYKRVVAEAERRERERMMAMREAAQQAAQGEGEAANAATPRNGRPASKKPKLPDGMEAKEARHLFKEFVQAKKAAGENTSGLTYGGLVQKLARELPKLQAKHGKNVSFEVTTVNGKVRLRARARRST
jgi:hypothetical protein